MKHASPGTMRRNFLDTGEERNLLAFARATLKSFLAQEPIPEFPVDQLTPSIRSNHGAFVTLRTKGELRGCIGATSNTEPLYKSVKRNAINAASRDPRFKPIRADDLDTITIEISALHIGDTPESPFKRITDPNDIAIGADGLFIKRPGERGGLLLPQVATDHKLDPIAFLTATCRKAGYPDQAWQDPETELYIFSAQVFSE